MQLDPIYICLILTTIGTALGFAIKRLIDSVKALDTKLSDHIVEDKAIQTRLETQMNDYLATSKDKLDRILEKL
jgi:hypothetical protein